jgi:hypothetical protein
MDCAVILSTEYNFIFVHIPKTAGLSVTDAFGKYGRGNVRTLARSISRRLPFRESPDRAHFRIHDPASKIIQKLGRDVFDAFLSFSVVRDPFDHAVSHYEYMKQFRIEGTARKVGNITFEEYLRYRMKPPFWNDTIFARLPDQAYFLTDGTGQIVVDRIVRFENLAGELEALAANLRLPEFSLRHVNRTKARSDRKPYTAYYTPETEETVRRLYRRDFALFGYPDRLPAPQGS